jgi:hypothetical protein
LLTVAYAVGFPSSGTFTIVVDNEQMTVTGGAGTTTSTVTLTAPVEHNPGAPVNLGRDSRPTLTQADPQVGFYQFNVLNKVNPSRILLGTTGHPLRGTWSSG